MVNTSSHRLLCDHPAHPRPITTPRVPVLHRAVHHASLAPQTSLEPSHTRRIRALRRHQCCHLVSVPVSAIQVAVGGRLAAVYVVNAASKASKWWSGLLSRASTHQRATGGPSQCRHCDRVVLTAAGLGLACTSSKCRCGVPEQLTAREGVAATLHERGVSVFFTCPIHTNLDAIAGQPGHSSRAHRPSRTEGAPSSFIPSLPLNPRSVPVPSCMLAVRTK